MPRLDAATTSQAVPLFSKARFLGKANRAYWSWRRVSPFRRALKHNSPAPKPREALFLSGLPFIGGKLGGR